jgi:hypothetical protein
MSNDILFHFCTRNPKNQEILFSHFNKFKNIKLNHNQIELMIEMVKKNFVLTSKFTSNQLQYFITKIHNYGKKSIFLKVFLQMLNFEESGHDFTDNKKKVLLLLLDNPDLIDLMVKVKKK